MKVDLYSINILTYSITALRRIIWAVIWTSSSYDGVFLSYYII